MKQNPSYTREQAAGTCAKIEKRSKEKHKSDTEEELNMKLKEDAVEKFLELLDSFKELFFEADEEVESDDLVEEEYQGNRELTLSQRAKMFHSISDEEWEALTDEEKQGYIDKLPPEDPTERETNKDEEDCEDCEDDEETEEDEEADKETDVVEVKEKQPERNVLEDAKRIWEDREFIIG